MDTGTSKWRDLAASEQVIAVMTPLITYIPIALTVYATPQMNLVLTTTDMSFDLTSWQIRATRKRTRSTIISTAGII